MREVEDGLLLRWQEDADGVYVPEGVTTIGKGLFRGNTAIRSIDIPESVRTIGDFAFDNCHGLTGIRIPIKKTYSNNVQKRFALISFFPPRDCCFLPLHPNDALFSDVLLGIP